LFICCYSLLVVSMWFYVLLCVCI